MSSFEIDQVPQQAIPDGFYNSRKQTDKAHRVMLEIIQLTFL